MIGTIEKRMEFSSSPERVWKALTDGEELGSWFPDAGAFTLEPAAEGAFTWENHGAYSVRVERFEPPHRLAWRWCHEPGKPVDDGPNTLVEFALTAREDGGTTLDLVETGFLTEEHLKSNTGGWDSELGELETYLQAQAA